MDIKTHKTGSLMEVWGAFYKWLRNNYDIEFSYMQTKYADESNLDIFDNKKPEQLAYFITEFFENSKIPPPDCLIDIIKNYKIMMMELWDYPEWGYKDIKKPI